MRGISPQISSVRKPDDECARRKIRLLGPMRWSGRRVPGMLPEFSDAQLGNEQPVGRDSSGPKNFERRVR
jgi:hypothetical protein